jgi:hypothetical protein
LEAISRGASAGRARRVQSQSVSVWCLLIVLQTAKLLGAGESSAGNPA